ncbi:MAG: peptide-methionine (S)-S-oxide reductase [Candidatus Micrarchaeota archaeon]
MATELVAADRFYPAEKYHQKYNQKHKLGIGICGL